MDSHPLPALPPPSFSSSSSSIVVPSSLLSLLASSLAACQPRAPTLVQQEHPNNSAPSAVAAPRRTQSQPVPGPTSGHCALGAQRKRQGLDRKDLPEDGHTWHKYGHKMLMGLFSRAYYRCTQRGSGCRAKKTVDTALSGSTEIRITYDGVHNHSEEQKLAMKGVAEETVEGERRVEVVRLGGAGLRRDSGTHAPPLAGVKRGRDWKWECEAQGAEAGGAEAEVDRGIVHSAFAAATEGAAEAAKKFPSSKQQASPLPSTTHVFQSNVPVPVKGEAVANAGAERPRGPISGHRRDNGTLAAILSQAVATSKVSGMGSAPLVQEAQRLIQLAGLQENLACSRPISELCRGGSLPIRHSTHGRGGLAQGSPAQHLHHMLSSISSSAASSGHVNLGEAPSHLLPSQVKVSDASNPTDPPLVTAHIGSGAFEVGIGLGADSPRAKRHFSGTCEVGLGLGIASSGGADHEPLTLGSLISFMRGDSLTDGSKQSIGAILRMGGTTPPLLSCGETVEPMEKVVCQRLVRDPQVYSPGSNSSVVADNRFPEAGLGGPEEVCLELEYEQLWGKNSKPLSLGIDLDLKL